MKKVFFAIDFHHKVSLSTNLSRKMITTINSLKILVFIFLVILQYVQTYAIPSTPSSGSDSIDWDEYMIFPKEDSHGVQHHNDHSIIKPKSTSDQHQQQHSKPIEKVESPKTPEAQSKNDKKRKRVDSKIVNSPTSSDGSLTDAQVRKKAVNRKYYVKNQVQLRANRNEKYKQEKQRSRNL